MPTEKERKEEAEHLRDVLSKLGVNGADKYWTDEYSDFRDLRFPPATEEVNKAVRDFLNKAKIRYSIGKGVVDKGWFKLTPGEDRAGKIKQYLDWLQLLEKALEKINHILSRHHEDYYGMLGVGEDADHDDVKEKANPLLKSLDAMQDDPGVTSEAKNLAKEARNRVEMAKEVLLDEGMVDEEFEVIRKGLRSIHDERLKGGLSKTIEEYNKKQITIEKKSLLKVLKVLKETRDDFVRWLDDEVGSYAKVEDDIMAIGAAHDVRRFKKKQNIFDVRKFRGKTGIWYQTRPDALKKIDTALREGKLFKGTNLERAKATANMKRMVEDALNDPKIFEKRKRGLRKLREELNKFIDGYKRELGIVPKDLLGVDLNEESEIKDFFTKKVEGLEGEIKEKEKEIGVDFLSTDTIEEQMEVKEQENLEAKQEELDEDDDSSDDYNYM